MSTYKDIYPLTVIKDRYSGVYSGGEYLAFNLDFCDIDIDIICDDSSCMTFWDKFDDIVGKGKSMEEAVSDLRVKLM